MPSKVKFYDRYGNLKAIDEILTINGSGLVTSSYIEHEIHEGHHFYMEGFTTLAKDLGGDEGTLYVKLVTPDTDTGFYFRWSIESSGILETNLYEGASGGMGGGADETPLNNDRNSPNESVLVITKNTAVAISKGAKVASKKVGSTGFKSTAGGSADRSDEMVLKRNTIYFREFISGVADNIIAFRASWIEC